MFGITVDRSSGVSMLQQLTGQIRSRVLDGSLKGGDRLPPSRNLADELGIARNTIVQAYEQLMAEGYLESHTGSGTYVVDLAGCCPEARFACPCEAGPVLHPGSGRDMIRFGSGDPDMLHFPVTQYARLLKEACLDGQASLFGYGPSAGEWRLRCAIVQYLYRSKGISCQLGQVLVVPGAARGVELLARVLAGGGESVAVEDPCIDFVQHILQYNGNEICPVTVDRSGMVTDALPRDRKVRLIYVVPSHQFPTGAVMPIGRRLQLLEYARQTDAYIIEDDYDSEYRYESGPLQSLRHLDPERVIYMGTFSKILSPALRVAYMVVPTLLQERLSAAMEQVNLRTAVMEQVALAAFIEGNLLDRHVYRMKKIYEKKRAHIISELRHAFGRSVSIAGENAGMHVLAVFSGIAFEHSDFQEFKKLGVEVDWAEDFAIMKGHYLNKLVLGYGSLSLEQISEGVRRLKEAVDAIRQSRAELAAS